MNDKNVTNIVDKLKTMRPDNLEGFKTTFMNDCLSSEAIKYDACLEKQANVRYVSIQAYNIAIGQCMCCKSGEVYDINSSNGKVMCHKILKNYV